jgi:hypothetical protein
MNVNWKPIGRAALYFFIIIFVFALMVGLGMAIAYLSPWFLLGILVLGGLILLAKICYSIAKETE